THESKKTITRDEEWLEAFRLLNDDDSRFEVLRHCPPEAVYLLFQYNEYQSIVRQWIETCRKSPESIKDLAIYFPTLLADYLHHEATQPTDAWALVKHMLMPNRLMPRAHGQQELVRAVLMFIRAHEPVRTSHSRRSQHQIWTLALQRP